MLNNNSEELFGRFRAFNLCRRMVQKYKHGDTGIERRCGDKSYYANELARYYIAKTGRDNLVIPVPMSSFPVKAKRPGFSAMLNKKLSVELSLSIPRWERGVDEVV